MAAKKLQKKIGKRKPFESPEQEAILNMLRTNELFGNQFGKLLREYGLTGSQYNVLRILRGHNKPLPSLEIAKEMVHVVPAITGLIDRLEKQDYVRRERCEEDRRVVYVHLTKKATGVLEQLDMPMAALTKQLIGHLSRTELRELMRLLEKARVSLE